MKLITEKRIVVICAVVVLLGVAGGFLMQRPSPIEVSVLTLSVKPYWEGGAVPVGNVHLMAEQQGYNVLLAAKLTKEMTLYRNNTIILNSSRDSLKDQYGVVLNLAITMQVYNNSSQVIYYKVFDFGSGHERTVRIYNAQFEVSQPLRVVLRVWLSVSYDGNVVFSKMWQLELQDILLESP